MDYSLGIEYGDLDSQISASSEYDSGNYGKLNCKLTSGYAWLPHSSDYTKKPWIQVVFPTRLFVSGVSIKGRGDSNQYTKKLRILWSRDSSNFVNLGEFDGNTDNNTLKKITFPKPIHADAIRLQVMEYVSYPAFRFDVHYIPE